VTANIDQVVHSRKQQADIGTGRTVADCKRNPKQVERQEAIAKKVLQGISRRDREILTRFYLLEETQEQISGRNLSETQFRLLKSRAKASFRRFGAAQSGPARKVRENLVKRRR